jgi:hypothetical protein
VVKYSLGLAHQWPTVAPETGEFAAITALDGYLYAVGATGTFLNPGGRACLIEKYDQSGTRLWRAIPYAGPGEDVLQGVVAIGDRLFAVGYSSFGAGNYGVLILEIDPDTGDVLNTTLWGGAHDDLAYGAATDGSDLYVVGTSSSFASAEGNQVGQSDVFLLRYTLNRLPVADDQSVSADWGVAKDIELTGSDEDGDTLTYSIVEPPAHGTLTGDAPNLTYTSSCTYFGPDSFTFKVNDGTEDSNIATVSITVQKTYAFTGFKPPIDNAPVVNSAKAGSVIPVLWRITDLCGAPISDPTSFKSLTSYSITCGEFTGDPVDELETYAGSSGLQYFSDGNWQYNWKTPKSYAPQCRIMVLTLADGSTHTAYFKFK